MHHERIGIGAQLGDDERHLVRHQSADEVDIAAQAAELGDHDRRLQLAGGLEGRRQLWPAFQCVVTLGCLDFLKGITDERVAFGLRE